MPGRQTHRSSEWPRKRACRRLDLVDDGREDAARPRVVEAAEDDTRVDSANAIQEICDPEGEGPPADEVPSVRGLIVTWPLRAHRGDDASDDVSLNISVYGTARGLRSLVGCI